MRFALHEVLSGMLASIEQDGFADDVGRLVAMFEDLAKSFSLFAPLAAGVDQTAVQDVLRTLEARGFVQHGTGQYVLTMAGRAHCVSSKRTLFSQRDREQLEEAARLFNTLERPNPA